jgi:hypothetical protein
MPKAVSQAVIDRAIRAAVARGLTVSGIELQPDGTVRILTGGAYPGHDLARGVDHARREEP